MGNMRRILVAVVTVAVVLTVGLAVGVVAAVRKPLPDTAGSASLTGLDGTVVVTRDRYGIPSITARTADDLFFAQGYVHAQDRFHEMDVRRHVARGTFSALVGDRGRELDRVIGALRIPDAARREQRGLPASGRRVLDAYARGVNAYIEGKSGSALSLEYAAKSLIGRDYRPDQWTSTDSVAWSGLLAWNLDRSVVEEIDRVMIARHMPSSRVADLYPGFPMADSLATRSAGGLDASSDVQRLARLRQALVDVAKVTGLPTPTGTQAWVEKSRAGDPVLTAQVAAAVGLPGPWYQVGLHCVQVTTACPYDVSGVSLSGLPGVVVGHNDKVGWGLGPALPSDARLALMTSSRATALPVIARFADGRRLVLRPDDSDGSNVDGVLALNRASDASAAKDAAERLRLPFALVYADASGDSGQVPKDPEAPRRPTARSPLADLLVPSLLPVVLTTSFADEGKETLDDWNREMSGGTPAAAYFAAVWREVLALTFHDELPQAQWPDGSSRWMVVMRRLLAKPKASWWDNLATPTVVEQRDDILRQAMESARDDLTMARARDVAEWDWADLHAPMLRNPTLDGRLFERGPVPMSGSGDTSQATAWNAGRGFEAVTIPVARLSMRLATPDASRWVVSTGQSGHAFADHYTDQAAVSSAGHDLPWAFSSSAVKKAAVDRLTLSSPTQ